MIAFKELLAKVTGQSEAIDAIRADMELLRASGQEQVEKLKAEIVLAKANLAKANESLAASEAEKAALVARAEKAEQAAKDAEAKLTDFDKKVSERAQAMVAELGHAPIPQTPTDDPAKAAPKEPELRGMDRVIAAFKKQSQPK